MSTPGNLAFRSPAARKLMRGTRKAKRTNMNMKNNLYVASDMEAPELDMSYLNERNFNVRKNFNLEVLGSSVGRNKKLTQNQIMARRNVAMKMAKGEPVSYIDKVRAGMVAIPKPSMPRTMKAPASVGGKKTRKQKHRK